MVQFSSMLRTCDVGASAALMTGSVYVIPVPPETARTLEVDNRPAVWTLQDDCCCVIADRVAVHSCLGELGQLSGLTVAGTDGVGVGLHWRGSSGIRCWCERVRLPYAERREGEVEVLANFPWPHFVSEGHADDRACRVLEDFHPSRNGPKAKAAASALVADVDEAGADSASDKVEAHDGERSDHPAGELLPVAPASYDIVS
jgi:hypothetical protein